MQGRNSSSSNEFAESRLIPLQKKSTLLKKQSTMLMKKVFAVDFKGEKKKETIDNCNFYCILPLSQGRFASCGNSDYSIKLWDINGDLKDPVLSMKGHTNFVWTITKVEDQMICSGSSDKTIKLWNWILGTLIVSVKAHDGFVTSLICIQQPKTVYQQQQQSILLSSSYDGQIKMWVVIRQRQLQFVNVVAQAHQNIVWALVQLSQEEVASCSEDGKMRIWQIPEFKLIHESFYGESLSGLLKLDDDTLVLGGKPCIRVISTKDWQCTKIVQQHYGNVWHLVKIDLSTVASGGSDNFILFWDTKTWEAVYKISLESPSNQIYYRSFGFIASDMQIVIGDYKSKKISVWQ